MSIKVKNLTSPRSGRAICNQFVITDDGRKVEIFQSYGTTIARRGRMVPSVVLDTNALDYSRTTSKYLYEFLGMGRKEIEARIKSGSIGVENLNGD